MGTRTRKSTKIANVSGALQKDAVAPIVDVHQYDTQLRRTHINCKKKMGLLNYKLVADYDAELVRQAFAKATRLKHLKTINNLTEFVGKNWKDVTRNDIRALLTTIMEQYADERGQESNTSYDHKKILRLFVRWVFTGIRERDPQEGELEILRDVRLRRVRDTLTREQMITDDDMVKLSIACGTNQMLRAMIWVAYDGGPRPSENFTLRIRDVTIEDDGYSIVVDGKTGQRPIFLIKSTRALSQWLNIHPFKHNREWPLWIQLDQRYYGRAVSYATLNKWLKNIVKKSGINKKVYWNLFRHSEATNSCKILKSDQLLKKRHGWSPNSKMAARYTHLVDEDVKEQMMNHFGITKTDKTPKFDKKCQGCNTSNPLDATYCSNCNMPVDMETRIQLREDAEE